MNAASVLMALGLLANAASPAAALDLFRERNFRGVTMTVPEADSNMRFSARSLKTGGGEWMLCPRPFYGGTCITVNKDTADLRLPRGFSGEVKSVRPIALPAPTIENAP